MSTYHHGNLRAALIETAIELIREHGPEGFTLREVARRANVSHAAPYRHFRDKADLVAAIAEDGFRDLDAAMDRAADRERTARAKLVQAGLAYVELALRRPEHFKVMFTAPLDKELHPAARAAAEAAFGRLVSLVTPVSKDDPLTTARICWAQVHGIAQLAVHQQLAFKRQKDVLEFAETALNALLEGL